MYCIKSGLISSSCSSDAKSMISLKPLIRKYCLQPLVALPIVRHFVSSSGEASL
jgi:hypothetical protein